MSKQDGATEKATPRKKEKAREEGDVPFSKDFGFFFHLLGLYIFVTFMGDWFVRELYSIFFVTLDNFSLDMNPGDALGDIFLSSFLITLGGYAIFTPLVILNYVIQVGFNFAPKSVIPKFSKLNPKNFVQKVFSKKGLVDVARSMATVAIILYAFSSVLLENVELFAGGSTIHWRENLVQFQELFFQVLQRMVIAFFVISFLDFLYQKYEYGEKLKMKKEDVKREQKDDTGDPHMNMKKKQEMMSLMEKKVDKKMDESTFVVTNPTHYAVAISFDPGKGNPKVVAKGEDHLAVFMKSLAKEKNIPIVERPPFARALHRRVEEGEEIPKDLWYVLKQIILMLAKKKKIKFDL